MARKQFATWIVGEDEYKLKLKASAICSLEEKMKISLMDVLGSSRTVPALTVMLTVVHAAMSDYNSGIKRKEVDDIYDKYTEEGGSILQFFNDVFMEIYKVSGFFTETQAEMMEENQEKVREAM